MSESSNSAWPFGEIPDEEGLDIAAIFKDSADTVDQGDPFAAPVEPAAPAPAPEAQEPTAESIELASVPEPTAAPAPTPREPETPAVPEPKPAAAPPAEKPVPAQPEVSADAENPIAAAFEKKTAENTKKGLLEKLPVFYHKGVKEEIEDPSMTFEELRIRKSEDFTDLEEGKRVSWSVEYCGIRKEVKDPKGTTIISMKETIERSREFLEALKKTKEKNPCCYVKPKVEMKTKGNAAYKGKFGTLEEARASDKVICLIPARDGRIYELRKMEQGEFIAPKNNVVDFSEIRAGFIPALPKIPAQLMGQIIAFFRTFMTENEENEALALIYWDKEEKRFFAYVPKQSVCKEEVEADLHGCPYDDEERYICYADIHSHNSMDAFFSGKDDRDERSVGLYFVLGELDHFYPEIKARVFCGDNFVTIDPATVIEGLAVSAGMVGSGQRPQTCPCEGGKET
jgi:PRTRC genetic system protein A